jgi:hypothetical protein
MICKLLLLTLYSLIGAVLTFSMVELFVKPYIRKKNDSNEFLSEIRLIVFFSGFLEVLLYAGSFALKKPEFIILWIGVKTALRWDRKRKKEEEISDRHRRGMYHSFLIGTSLNIIFGLIAYSLVFGITDLIK